MGVIKQSFAYVKQDLGKWIVVWLMGIAMALCTTLLPQAPQIIIDRIINPLLGGEAVVNSNNIFAPIMSLFTQTDYINMFICIAGVFVGVNLVRYILHYMRWNFSLNLGVRVENRIRKDMFNKFLTQGQLTLERYSNGEIMGILNSFPALIKDFWGTNISKIIAESSVIIFAIYFLSNISLLLTIVPLSVGIVTVIVVFKYTKALQIRYEIIRQGGADLSSFIQDNVNGIRVVKSSNAEKNESEKFDTKNEEVRKRYLKLARTTAFYQMWFSGLSQGINIASTAIGVYMAIKGTISIGEFTTFLSYVFMINAPLITVASQIGAGQNAIACGIKLFFYYNLPDEHKDTQNPKELNPKCNLALDNVSVEINEEKVLDGVSIDIPYGKNVGVMGGTASGKSTLLKTLARLVEPTTGAVLVDDNNIKDYALSDIRGNVSFVGQEPFLFSDTVANNVALASGDITQEQIEIACKRAKADKFITALEKGYDTVVGEKGIGLSGGQKQRVSIARALAKNSPILIFDDPTSSLDTVAEDEVINNIFDNYSDHTIVIASHRVSAVEKCDEILYIESGRIVESGTHAELMELNGKYCDIYIKQSTRKGGIV